MAKSKNKEKIIDLYKRKEIDFSQEVRLFGFCKIRKPGFTLNPPFDLCGLCVDKTNTNYVAPLKDLTIYLIGPEEL